MRHIAMPTLKRAFYVAVFSFIICQPNSLTSLSQQVQEGAGLNSRGFSPLAKKAMPAVVSIRVQLSTKKLQAKGELSDDQLDPFQEEFFRRFFGAPQGFSQPRPDKKAQPPMAGGSGFIISPNGSIVTNNHVVANADKITVILNDGKEYVAQLVGGDANTDVALLKIDAKNLPFLRFANSDKLEIGDWVIAIGNPLGFRASLTTGVVSAKGRNDLDVSRVEEFIQTDAAINQGNSGGPLLNIDGDVAGVNTAIATTTGGNMGINLAIPSNIVKHVTDQLEKNGKVIRGFLGVTLQRIDFEMAKAFGLDQAEGALVSEVIKGEPADKAGLKSGDIILKLNGREIENSGALRNAISLLEPNQTAVFTVLRNGKNLELKATIGSHPDNEANATDVQNAIGVLVQELNQEVIQRLGLNNDDKGVVIKYVAPNSVADLAGLHEGQLIITVNRMPVSTSEDFYKQVLDNASGNQVLLQIKDGRNSRFVLLQTE